MYLGQRVRLVALCLTFLVGCTQQNQLQLPPPPNANVAKPVIQTVTNYLEETGTSQAKERVEIRARVSGFLERVEFTDGQDVKKGDRLYLIQQSEYQAAFDQASANVDLKSVEVERAKIERDRQKRLLAENATPESKFVQAQSEFDSALAEQKVAIAAREKAQLDLDYCEVKSPIDGRVERTLIKLGNLVGSDGATQLTTVVSYDPIHVYFNISERALLRAAKSTPRDAKSERVDLTTIKAYVRRALDDGFPFEGNLDYADLGVDQSTGTFTIRAVFPNPRMDILPGLFVRVRIKLGTTKDAVLLPERSIGFDQVGRYVMIVGDGNVVERRNVEVGAKYGEMVVIASGLSGEETVVIDGIQRARPGSEVTPKEIQLPQVQGSLENVQVGNLPIDEADSPAPQSSETGSAPSGGPESEAAESSPKDDGAESTTPAE